MRKIFRRNRTSVSVQDEQNTTDLIKGIQEQLVSLEKKVDILISQSDSQPSERHFKSYRPNRRRQDGSFRERNFTQVVCADCGKECEVPFKPSADRPVYCRDCFAKRKGVSSFRGKREDNFGGEGREFGRKKKPFFRRRK